MTEPSSDPGRAERRRQASSSPGSVFLKHPLTAEAAYAELPELRGGVDSAAPGRGAPFLPGGGPGVQDRIQRFMALPVVQQITVRNWRTTTGLAELLDGRS